MSTIIRARKMTARLPDPPTADPHKVRRAHVPPGTTTVKSPRPRHHGLGCPLTLHCANTDRTLRVPREKAHHVEWSGNSDALVPNVRQVTTWFINRPQPSLRNETLSTTLTSFMKRFHPRVIKKAVHRILPPVQRKLPQTFQSN